MGCPGAPQEPCAEQQGPVSLRSSWDGQMVGGQEGGCVQDPGVLTSVCEEHRVSGPGVWARWRLDSQDLGSRSHGAGPKVLRPTCVHRPPDTRPPASELVTVCVRESLAHSFRPPWDSHPAQSWACPGLLPAHWSPSAQQLRVGFPSRPGLPCEASRWPTQCPDSRPGGSPVVYLLPPWGPRKWGWLRPKPQAPCSGVHALPSHTWKQAQERPQGRPARTTSVPGRPPPTSFPGFPVLTSLSREWSGVGGPVWIPLLLACSWPAPDLLPNTRSAPALSTPGEIRSPASAFS